MPTGDARQLAELISAPLEELITALGSGIGRAQAALDRHSIETQRVINEDPLLAEYGLEATWYQIPTTDLELKMAVAMERTAISGGGARDTPIGPDVMPAIPKLWVQPVNARYANQFSYDVNAASTVKLTVVAVPPPGTTSVSSESTQAQVLDAALSYLNVGDDGNPVPRLTINFNAGARAWYVVQTTEENDVVTLARLVKIEDGSLRVLKAVPPTESPR